MNFETFTTQEAKGGYVDFTVTDKELYIHTETMTCQFLRESVIPMLDVVKGSHGILRFADTTYNNVGLTLFLVEEDLVPLVGFLQTYTNSKVVV